MPGKARVHELAKELNVTAKQILEELGHLGAVAKSASSTIEAPVVQLMRQRHAGTARLASLPPARSVQGGPYPKNNPYMDLGKAEIDHLQAVDRLPRPPRQVAAPLPPRPGLNRIDPLDVPAAHARRPRREWWRGGDPSEFDRYVLETIIVPRRDEHTRPPSPPYHYFEDEVRQAGEITGRWSALMLSGMDYDEILDWRATLDPISIRSFIVDYADAPDDAIELHTAGVTPSDLRWCYGDEKDGTLPDRLRRGTMTVEEVVVEVEYRRHTN